MGKRIVIALGGNALGENLREQMTAARTTAKTIADLIEDGNEIVVTHGNGPQVGMITLAFETASQHDSKIPSIPLSVCVAMSQGYIGFDLQNALSDELQKRKIYKPVATIVTQTLVDGNDPAFDDPTKPIGSFYTESEADELKHRGYIMKEDSGRGWRRVVASPKPVSIVECETVAALLSAGHVPITVGGGGIPVIKTEDDHLVGVPAVVDKDFASAKLAEMLDADFLIILTAVEKVALDFGKPDCKWLDKMNTKQAEQYIQEGHFASGSMLPKVVASLMFVNSKPGRKALITMLQRARDGLEGKTGTVITN